MAFSERIRTLAKQKSAFRCCVCHEPFVEVHHLVPQAEGGDDSLKNAAPLCASCHDLYGGNPEKRKVLRQMRDYWWSHMKARWKRIVRSESIDDSVHIAEDHSSAGLKNQKVVIYHLVLKMEKFLTSAEHIMSLLRSAQKMQPGKRRCLFLDIEGHRNENGGFDQDMFELQRHFILGFASQWLSEMHLPLTSVKCEQIQSDDIPQTLDVVKKVDAAAINRAFDTGMDRIWIADRDKYICFD